MTGTRTSVGGSLLPGALVVAIAFYIAMDSIFLRVFPGQRAVYAGIVVVSLAVLIVGMTSLKLSLRECVLVSGLLLLNCVWLILALGHEQAYPKWIIGDFVSLLLPCIILLVAGTHPHIVKNRRLLALFAAMLIVGAILGALYGIGPNNRFESPATMLFPLSWLAFSVSHDRSKVLFGAVVVILGGLAFGAGERTAIVIWLLSGLAVYGLVWSLRRIIVVVILIGVLGSAFGAALFQAGVRDALEQTRFRQNIQGAVDTSLITRINEASDVGRMFRDASAVHKLLGYGHGASFRPVHSAASQNISSEGYLHHVHIGPALVLFRYGIVGLLLLLWLSWAVFKSLLRHRTKPPQHWNVMELAFTLALCMYLIDLLLRNVIADPAFSYVVAGFLFFQFRRIHADQSVKFETSGASYGRVSA